MNKIRGYALALLAVSILISAIAPIAFSLGSAIPFTTLLFYMSIAGTVASFFMMLARGTTSHLKSLLTDKTYIVAIVSLGILSGVIEPLGLSYTTHFISADLVAVIFRTWPIFLVLIAPLVIKERVSKWDFIGVFVGFMALAATIVGGTLISLPSAALPFIAILLVVSLCVALGSAISKRYNYELTSSVFGYNLIALAFFAPIAILTNTWRLTLITPSVIFAILFTGVVFYAIFGYIFYETLRLTKTSTFGLAYILVPFVTMLISASFLGVPVQLSYIVIGIGVACGVLIQKFAPKGSGNFIVSKKKKRHAMPLYDITAAFTNTARPEIYQTMKGGGRVLAFYTDSKHAGLLSSESLSNMSTEGCILFNDRYESLASPDEINFIREITGSTADHMVIMGSGNPDEVANRFYDIKDMLDSPPVV